VLVSREWLDLWPDNKQFILSRSVSNHCAIILKESIVDWGPKLFRCLDVWQRDGRFKDFVHNWISYEVQGGWIFVFKEKMKNLKADLKIWNKDIFGNVNHVGEDLQKNSKVGHT